MKVTTLHLTCALCGAVTGILLGRLASEGPVPSGQAAVPALAKERADRVSRVSTPGPASGHDFASLLKLQMLGLLDDSPLMRDLERMSPERLRELLLEIRDLPETEDEQEMEASRVMLQSVAAELFKREGMDTIPWADGMEKGRFRTGLMQYLIAEASFVSPAQAKPWIDRFISDNGDHTLNDFRWKLMSGAQSRGAEDVIELEKLFGDQFSTILKPAIPYPEGFDYQKLFTGIQPEADRRGNHSMWYWTQVDKEAAWKGILETVKQHGKNGAYYYGALFSGAQGLEDPAARKWAVAKLDEMPDEF
ncbi:MAG: hypothetical protein EOP85_04000, partial [Verrucomicrobiaceae bacterium]